MLNNILEQLTDDEKSDHGDDEPIMGRGRRLVRKRKLSWSSDKDQTQVIYDYLYEGK